MEDLKNFEKLTFEYLFIGCFMKKDVKDFSNNPVDPSVLSLLSQLGAAPNYKRRVFETQAEKLHNGQMSSGGWSLGECKEGDDIDVLKLKKMLEEIEVMKDRAEIISNDMQKMVREMPDVSTLIEQHTSLANRNTYNPDGPEAIKFFKIHQENVVKANLLLRALVSSPNKLNLRDPTMKKMRAFIDGILNGTYYDVSNIEKYDC